MRTLLWLLLLGCHRRAPYIPPDDVSDPDTAAPGDTGSAPPAPGGYTALSAGGWSTCGIRRADGGLACWWEGPGALADYGQTAPPEGAFVAVSAGMWHACALDEAGAVSCWGHPGGKLDAPEERFASISAGMVSTCGVTVDGEARCWADDGESLGVEGDALDVDPGPRSTCAVRGAGTVSCLGGHIPSPDGAGYVSVSSGAYFACGRDEDGAVDCWGDNRYGQLDAPEGRYTAVAVGVAHACALEEAGGVRCWGDDSYGQSSPPDATLASLTAGTNHTCGLTEAGEAVCWGSLSDGVRAAGEALSHDAHVQPIWDAHCLGCHAGDEVPKLSLLRANAYDIVTGVSWSEGLADTGAPERSRLLQRMQTTGDFQMPPTHVVPDAQVQQVYDWVVAGAPP